MPLNSTTWTAGQRRRITQFFTITDAWMRVLRKTSTSSWEFEHLPWAFYSPRPNIPVPKEDNSDSPSYRTHFCVKQLDGARWALPYSTPGSMQHQARLYCGSVHLIARPIVLYILMNYFFFIWSVIIKKQKTTGWSRSRCGVEYIIPSL